MAFYHRFVQEQLDNQGALVDFPLVAPEHFNFGYDVVDAMAQETPDKRALVWCNARHEERFFSFRELSDLSTQAANVFASYGIQKGDRVMLLLKRHYEYWYALVGLHKLGAVAIPATNLLSAPDLAYRINAAQVAAVVSTPEDGTPDALLQIKPQCPSLRHLFIVRGPKEGFVDFTAACAQASPVMERIETDVRDPMLLYFTSGTTAQPKAVLHDFSYPLAHIITARYWQNVQEDGLHLSISDTGWGKASWGKIYGQWLCGCAVMVYDYDQFSPRAITHVIRKYGVNTFCAPPTVFRYLIRQHITREDFGQVSYITTAGEALNPEVAKQFESMTGLHIHEGFGQTESVLILGNLAGDPPREGNSIGRASPLYHVAVLNSDGTPTPDGEVGELVLLKREDRPQYGIFMGYGGAPLDGSTVWQDGIYHTHDLVTRDPDGYFHYVSRTDDVIKSCGYRVSPFEVESVLMEHPAVMECAVTGIPDPGRGYALKASIVLSPGFSADDALKKELNRYCRDNLAVYKRPRSIVFADQLPKTVSGKIRRAEIRQADQASAQSTEA